MPKENRPYLSINSPLTVPYPFNRQSCKPQLQQQESSQNSVPRSFSALAALQHHVSYPSTVSQSSSINPQQQVHLWTNAIPQHNQMQKEVRGLHSSSYWTDLLPSSNNQHQKKESNESDIFSAYQHQDSLLEQRENHISKKPGLSQRSSFESNLPEKTGAILRKGRWSRAEDQRLMASIELYGPNKWKAVASDVGTRTGDQCWKRWNDSLDPTLKHDPWTEEEDENLLQAVRELGRAWSKIATERLNGRSGLSCKNRIDHLHRRHRRLISFNSGQIYRKLNRNMSSEPRNAKAMTHTSMKEDVQPSSDDVVVNSTLTPIDPVEAAAKQLSTQEARAEQEAANALYSNLRYDPMMPFSLTHDRDNIQANFEASAAMTAAAAAASESPCVSSNSNITMGKGTNSSSQMQGRMHSIANTVDSLADSACASVHRRTQHPRTSLMAFDPLMFNVDEGYRSLVQQAHQVYRGHYPIVPQPRPNLENTSNGQWTNIYLYGGNRAPVPYSQSIIPLPLSSACSAPSNTMQQSVLQKGASNEDSRALECFESVNRFIGTTPQCRPIDGNIYLHGESMNHTSRSMNQINESQGDNPPAYPSNQQSSFSILSSPVSEMGQSTWNVPRDTNRGSRNPLDISALTSPTNVDPMSGVASRRATNYIDKSRLEASYYATAHHAADIANLISPEITASVDVQQISTKEEEPQSTGDSSTSFSLESQQLQTKDQIGQPTNSVIHQNVQIHGYDDSEFFHEDTDMDAEGESEEDAVEETHVSNGHYQ